MLTDTSFTLRAVADAVIVGGVGADAVADAVTIFAGSAGGQVVARDTGIGAFEAPS